MTDPQRFDRPADSAALPERDREARVEELLLTGLDHYFAGQYDLAINVWTRVLFLDRGHARARAYIERARSAISERQREGEELLHSGAAAFDRGDAGAARRLLTSAMERGAASDEAFSLLDRIDRLQAAQASTDSHGDDQPHAQGARAEEDSIPSVGRSRLVWVAVGVVAGMILASLGGVYVWTHRSDWLALGGTSSRTASVRPPDEPLPLPAPSEVWLARARALHAKGRLHEAMQALDSIRLGDPLRPDADQERATIQNELLAAARGAGASRDQGAASRR
jgi:hypothetical protein